jgi:CheY-like chemotaxis protein
LSQLLKSEQAAREEAEQAGRTKDEFLATLSHELRTPLNAIVGWSQLLRRDGRSDEDLEQGLETIERNARTQAQLIDDLLDMSRIVSGKLRLEVKPIDPAVFIDAAIETVQSAADAKKIRVEKVLDPRAGPVSGDPNRLQQVVWNLLSNAIKFTPHGGMIRISLTRLDFNVRLCIADNGVGMSAEFLPHVFERFRQADGSTTRRHTGLGLGLAIVKQLVELHGGEVSAESRGIGQGSTFTVTLPLDLGPNAAQAGEDAQADGLECNVSLAGVKVLAVDDEPDALQVVKRILQRCDAVVHTCNSAEAALAAVEQFIPDVIVSDIGMPETDGYQLLPLLKARLVRKVPAIALTAFARPEDRKRALLAGYRAHLAKPVEPAELVAMVASMTERK